MTTDQKKLESDLRWVCRSWWRAFHGIDKDDNHNRDRADRKSRAELRRAGSIASDGGDAINLISAYGVELFHALLRRVQEKALWIGADQAALAAITLAHVEKDIVASENDALSRGQRNFWAKAILLSLPEARFKPAIPDTLYPASCSRRWFVLSRSSARPHPWLKPEPNVFFCGGRP